jgi:lysophospholipase L1-like esterase
MARQIDQFYHDLQLKLTNIGSGIDQLKAKVSGKADRAEQDVRVHLDQVRRRIEQDRAKAVAAQGEVNKWVEQKKTATNEKIAEWKANREVTKLQNHAEMAERYAAAAIDVALATLDEAEQAALEAWLARQDANTATSRKAS